MTITPPFPDELIQQNDLSSELENIVQDICQPVENIAPLLFIHMLGMPGAGKTTYAEITHKHLQDSLESPIALLAFDRIMEAMPTYKTANDKIEAFKEFELPARNAGYVALKRLLEQKSCVLFDHGGAAEGHVDILKHAKGLGYKTAVLHITTTQDTAKNRIQHRAEQTGRHTPLHYIDDRSQLIEQLIPHYKNAADLFRSISNTEQISNSAEVPKEIKDMTKILIE